jgi:hypothetical protein
MVAISPQVFLEAEFKAINRTTSPTDLFLYQEELTMKFLFGKLILSKYLILLMSAAIIKRL